MKEKKEYWQEIRGICILAVVLIHALGGFAYTDGEDTGFIILRQIINFTVATFVFMAGYFVDVDRSSNGKCNSKSWLKNRGATPYTICSLVIDL